METIEVKEVKKQEEKVLKQTQKEEEAPVDPTKEQVTSIKTILKSLKPEEQNTVFNLLAEEGFWSGGIDRRYPRLNYESPQL